MMPSSERLKAAGRRVSRVLTKYITFAWLLIFVVPGYWALDRLPPVRVTGYVPLVSAMQGSTALFAVPVARDLWRECNTQFRKIFTDSAGVRYDFGIEQEISHEAMAEIERRVGPFIKGSVQTPDVAATGLGTLLVGARFTCNPLHRLWPITKTIEIPVIVVPRKKEGGK